MTPSIQLPWHRRLTIGLAFGFVAAVACSKDITVPADTSLDGAWTARSSGVTALLNLVWTRDSVHGTGTYNVIGNSLGCGGGVLTGSGSLTFRASRSGSTVTGIMAFDNRWSPPYVGTLEDKARINGAFHSIDAGNCSFGLYFGLIP